MDPNSYEEQWDEFLDAYQSIKTQKDAYRLLLEELIENIESEDDKRRYQKAYKEIQNGTRISNS